MPPDHPPWLVRWQQAEDDELLYVVDETLRRAGDVPPGTPICWTAIRPEDCLAMPHEEDPDEP